MTRIRADGSSSVRSATVRRPGWRRMLAGVVVLLAAGLAAHTGPPPERPPDIVFILYDDLHWDDLTAYGGRSIRTPNIDRLAAEGMRFTQFYSSAPVCSPARIGLLTGLYPARLNVRSVLKKAPNVPTGLLELEEVAQQRWSNRGIPSDVTTLPELLEARGYRTVHIGKWHVGAGRPEFRAPAVGFDQSVIVSGRMPDFHTDPSLWADDAARWSAQGHSTDLITTAAVEALEGRDDRPLFLSLWYPAPHEPLEPPPRWESEYPASERGRFAAMVAHLDENLGRILGALEASGTRNDTLILLSSDNGGVESFHQDSRLRGGKSTLFEGGVRVPLLASWPSRVEPGSVEDTVLMGFDLLPTLAELAGLDTAQLEIDGESFAPVLLGRQRRPGSRTLLWEHRLPFSRPDGSRLDRWAIRDGDLKLHFDGQRLWLFDLGDDPGESSDLSAARPDAVAELTSKYERWRIETGRLRYGALGARGAVRWARGAAGDPAGRASVVRASFDGEGSVTLRPHALFDFHDGDFTASLWVRLAPDALSAAVLMERRGTWRLGWNQGDRLTLQLWSEDGSVAKVQARKPFSRDRWHHVAFTAGGTSLERRTSVKLYVDGVEVAEGRTSAAPVSSREPVVLGCGNCGKRETAHFTGDLASLRFYTMEMTAAEVARLADETHPDRSSGTEPPP